MRKGFRKAVAVFLTVIMTLSPALPVFADGGTGSQTYHYDNDQIYGLVFWGTSGMARVYQDLGKEIYGNVTGESEQEQHVWTSAVDNYDYMNYPHSANYSVADATTVAYYSSSGKAVPCTQTDLSGNLTPAYNGTFTSVFSSSGVHNSGTGVMGGLETAYSLGWGGGPTATGDSDTEPWNEVNTAVVIWAGEDWLINDVSITEEADGWKTVLKGFDDADSLQIGWMGQTTVEEGVELARKNGSSTRTAYDLGVHNYWPVAGSGQDVKTGSYAEVSGYYFDGSWDGLTGSAHSASEADYSDVLTGSNEADAVYGSAGYTHSSVFGNSYMIDDALLENSWTSDGTGHMASGSGFVYSSGDADDTGGVRYETDDSGAIYVITVDDDGTETRERLVSDDTVTYYVEEDGSIWKTVTTVTESGDGTLTSKSSVQIADSLGNAISSGTAVDIYGNTVENSGYTTGTDSKQTLLVDNSTGDVYGEVKGESLYYFNIDADASTDTIVGAELFISLTDGSVLPYTKKSYEMEVGMTPDALEIVSNNPSADVSGLTQTVSVEYLLDDSNNKVGIVVDDFLYELDTTMSYGYMTGGIYAGSTQYNYDSDIIKTTHGAIGQRNGSAWCIYSSYVYDEDGNQLRNDDGTAVTTENGIVRVPEDATLQTSYVLYDEYGNAVENVTETGQSTLVHQLNEVTDAFPVDAELPTQAATAFARILSGYDYTVEYLEQDTSQVSSITDIAEGEETVMIWVPEYHEAHDESFTMSYDNLTFGYNDMRSLKSYSRNLRNTEDNVGAYYDALDGRSGMYFATEDGHYQYHPATVIITDRNERYYVYEDDDDDDKNGDGIGDTILNLFRNSIFNAVGNLFTGNGMIFLSKTDTGDKYDHGQYVGYNHNAYAGNTNEFDYAVHDVTVSVTVHHPAYYVWRETEVAVHVRCDQDRSADYGYADSSHTHKYGGIDGLMTGTAVNGVSETTTGSQFESDYVNSGWVNVDYVQDYTSADDPYNDATEMYDGTGRVSAYADGAGAYYVSSGKGSAGDHSEDYAVHLEYYNDPDKPVMKVTTETRHVNGYIDFWKQNTSQNLKVYVFGLGPYNKSFYEDQMDDDWTDGVVTGGKDGYAEIARTMAYDEARQTWNKVLQQNLKDAVFVDIWDITANSVPYYRYQDIAYMTDSSLSNAQHGKWYDRNTDQWLFHMMWNTVLEDNPDPEADAALDASFYAVSSALTAYANRVVSFYGRSGPPDTAEDGDEVTGAEFDEETMLYDHVLLDVYEGGMSSAGAVLGYGDSSYGFEPYFTSDASKTSSTVPYASLIGIEGVTDNSDGSSPMYEYARYGKLLSDLGLDETGSEGLDAGRAIPGILIDVGYIANAGLVAVWGLMLDVLKALNPFQLLACVGDVADYAALVSEEIPITDPFTGEPSSAPVMILEFDETGLASMTPNPEITFSSGNESYTLNRTNSWLLRLVVDSDGNVRGNGFSRILIWIGELYNALMNMGWIVLIVLFAVLIATILFVYWAIGRGEESMMGRWAIRSRKLISSKVFKYLIRFVFILIGVPLIAFTWTAFLDKLSDTVDVTASPSSELIAATFVDFEGWAEVSRLAPVMLADDEAAFVSEGTDENDAGTPAAESVINLRHTASEINNLTGILPGINGNDIFGFMTRSEVASVTGSEDWNAVWDFAVTGVNDAVWKKLDEENESWTDQFVSLNAVLDFMGTYGSGEFYTPAAFSSGTMAAMTSNLSDVLGRGRSSNDKTVSMGGTQEESAGDDTVFTNANTVWQMFQETSDMNIWLGRDAETNAMIFTGSGDYGPASGEDEMSSDWSAFNIFANGAINTSYENGGPAVSGAASTIFYEPSETVSGGNGLDVSSHTGLSTMSMYNYLMTDFGDAGLTIYSPAEASGRESVMSHYSTNIIGSGITQWAFYLSCLAFLLVSGVVGIVYAVGMTWTVLKRAWKMFASIPFAMLGVMRSIVTVVTSLFMMMAEVAGSMLLYSVIAEFMMVIVTLFEGLVSSGSGSVPAAVIGGMPAVVSAVVTDIVPVSPVSMMLWLFGISAAFMLLSVWLIRRAPAVMCVTGLVTDAVFMKLVPEAVEAYSATVSEPGTVSGWDGDFDGLFTDILTGIITA